MRCIDCGGDFIELIGDLTLKNIKIGEFTVGNVSHRKCNNCGELLFPVETLKIIEAKEREIKEYRLSQYPIADFIGAVAAAKILGVTRQALHRNRRIRRGFIYFMHFGGKIAYLKKSVELYKDTGDGRFILAHPHITEQPEYTKETETQQVELFFDKPTVIDLGEQPTWKNEETILSDFPFIFSRNQDKNLTIH